MTASVVLVNTSNAHHTLKVSNPTGASRHELERGEQLRIGYGGYPLKLEIEDDEIVGAEYIGEVDVLAYERPFEGTSDALRAGIGAFERYRAAVGGTAHDGRPIPRWDQLEERQQRGWMAAARTGEQS